jgi:hypothetical protein
MDRGNQELEKGKISADQGTIRGMNKTKKAKTLEGHSKIMWETLEGVCMFVVSARHE